MGVARITFRRKMDRAQLCTATTSLVAHDLEYDVGQTQWRGTDLSEPSPSAHAGNSLLNVTREIICLVWVEGVLPFNLRQFRTRKPGEVEVKARSRELVGSAFLCLWVWTRWDQEGEWGETASWTWRQAPGTLAFLLREWERGGVGNSCWVWTRALSREERLTYNSGTDCNGSSQFNQVTSNTQ